MPGVKRRAGSIAPQGPHDPKHLVPSRFQLRVKTGAAVSTAVALAALLLYDWDAAQGHKTVFSGIRPALRSVLDRAYGVQPSAEGAAPAAAAAHAGQREAGARR